MEDEKQVHNTINMLISEAFEVALSLIEEGIKDPRIQRQGGMLDMQIKIDGFAASLNIDLNAAKIEVSQGGKLLYGNRPFWVEDPANAKRVIALLARELGSIYETAMIQRLKKSAASCKENEHHGDAC